MVKKLAINPSVKSVLKEYEEESGTEYAELLKVFKVKLDEAKAVKGKTDEWYDNRALFQVKRGLRGRPGARMVNLQAVVLGSTGVFDIAGKRRWSVINTVKAANEKSDDTVIDNYIANNELEMVGWKDHKEMIDSELAKDEPNQGLVNFLRRQEADGLLEEGKNKYVVVPLETREFFDDAGKRKNPNFGKAMQYADRRRIFLLGRTVIGKEVGDPILMVVEARLDQCYLFNAMPWDVLEGFAVRVREETETAMMMSTSRQTRWKSFVKQDTKGMSEEQAEAAVKSNAKLASLMEALEVENVDDDRTRVELLLSADESIQKTIDEIYAMYGKKEWTALMINYDRFVIVTADLLNKSDITLGFREQFLAEGTTPESLAYKSKSMNFWINKELEEQYMLFGNGSRVVWAGQLVDRGVWDEAEGKMSEETAPQLEAVCFAPVPEYKEEP